MKRYHDKAGSYYNVKDVIDILKEAVDDDTKDDIINNLSEVFKVDLTNDRDYMSTNSFSREK